MDTPAKQAVSDFITKLDAFLKGEAVNISPLLNDNVVVQVSGSSSISGRFPGKKIVRRVLAETVLSRINKNTWSVSLDRMIGAGPRIATLLTITGETIEGRVYNPDRFDCGCIFEVKDHLITEIWLFPDIREIETILFGRIFVRNQSSQSS
ncbi:MAG: hypothetical protein DCC73_03010 [Proteobacteria bacterium]|nr:MAG: hypothetical protein DCC73_03010 [Pseudomonadota bacterium]